MHKIILILLTCLSFSVFGQTSDSNKIKIIGKWAIYYDTVYNPTISCNKKYDVEFRKNGQYISPEKKFGTNPIQITQGAIGKWNFANDSMVINEHFIPPSNTSNTEKSLKEYQKNITHQFAITFINKNLFYTKEFGLLSDRFGSPSGWCYTYYFRK